jgi:hypothetical protein
MVVVVKTPERCNAGVQGCNPGRLRECVVRRFREFGPVRVEVEVAFAVGDLRGIATVAGESTPFSRRHFDQEADTDSREPCQGLSLVCQDLEVCSIEICVEYRTVADTATKDFGC